MKSGSEHLASSHACNSLLVTGNLPLPPGSSGLGLMGVVVVNSMMRYSRGSGRASRVTSPYSSFAYKKDGIFKLGAGGYICTLTLQTLNYPDWKNNDILGVH